jgi:hypothetical protein
MPKGEVTSFIKNRPMEIYRLVRIANSHGYIVPKNWVEWFCPHGLVEVSHDIENHTITLRPLTREEADEFNSLEANRKSD